MGCKIMLFLLEHTRFRYLSDVSALLQVSFSREMFVKFEMSRKHLYPIFKSLFKYL